jgi:hypothetical protein
LTVTGKLLAILSIVETPTTVLFVVFMCLQERLGGNITAKLMPELLAMQRERDGTTISKSWW